MAPEVLREVDGRVGRLVLNRPEAMNAITVDLGRELEAGLRALAAEVDVILVTGAGTAFCVGGDFDEVERLRAIGPDALAELFAAFGAACASIAELPVPVVCAAHGFAMAGGFELLQAADVVLVADDLKASDNHANFAMVPGGGGSQRLPRLIGRQRALAHMLTGERLRGPELVALGLAYRSVPAAELPAAADALAALLASKDRAALGTIKRLVLDGLTLPLADGLAHERRVVVDHIAGAGGATAIASFANRES